LIDPTSSLDNTVIAGPDLRLSGRDSDAISADRLLIRTQPKAVMAGLDPWASARSTLFSPGQKRGGSRVKPGDDNHG